MIDWTDRHCRYFHRLLTPSALLYTEMLHSAAIVLGSGERLLDNKEVSGPVALQLGGSEPAQMAAAAKAGERHGYAAININVGCPSDRVQAGQFGACLMARPQVVADCVAAMAAAVSLPVTVKTRIGIDDQDSDEFVEAFVATVAGAGCRSFVVHARIALLAGLSPKQNREIPPLNPGRVYRLKERCPDLEIVINGGIRDVDCAERHLARVDGVMIGRAAYQQPFGLTAFEAWQRPDYEPPSREEVVAKLVDYASRQRQLGIPLRAVARHTLGLFHGQPGARQYRRILSEGMHADDADAGLFWRALEATCAAPAPH